MDLAQLAVELDHPVDGQRVEVFVGNDHAHKALAALRDGHELLLATSGAHAFLDQGALAREIDRLIANRECQRRAIARKPIGDGQEQSAAAGAEFAQHEHGRLTKAPPQLVDLERERAPEDRVQLRRGQEVARARGPSGAGGVVAVCRVIQRALHEAGESDWPGCGYLVADGFAERRRRHR